MDQKTSRQERKPSPLALQLSDAFAPCAQWSEVRIERGAGGRRTRVILGPSGDVPAAAVTPPFDWAVEAR